MKQLVSIISLLAIILFVSCSDTTKPTNENFRYVYFPAGKADGAHDGETGLYRINIDNLELEHLVPTSVQHTTNVGKNGVIVIEYDDLNDERKLWGKCEDGSIVQVPFPTVDNIAYEYKLLMPPKIMLSADGHNVGYFVHYQLIDSDDPMEKELVLVKFNCSTGKMDMISLDSTLSHRFTDINANYFEPFGQYLQISKDGKKIWAVIRGSEYFEGEITGISYSIFLIDGLEVNALSNYSYEPIEIYSLNSISENLIVRLETGFKVFDDLGELANIPITENNFFQPYQLMTDRSEMAIWTEYGIELVNPDNGSLLKRVISFDEIDPTNELNRTPNKRLSISHDGEYIVFALPIKNDTGNYRLYIVGRGGNNLKILRDKVKLGIPVVSDILENKN